jgi:hypothetical protein
VIWLRASHINNIISQYLQAIQKQNKNKKTTINRRKRKHMERTNKVYIVGQLQEVKLRDGDKDGKAYIAGDIAVEVSEDNLIELKFFSFATTADGKANKRYANFKELESMKGRRVKVSGELSGRAFFQAGQGQVITFNEVTASFVNLAKDVDEPVATFEYSGFVYKPLIDRTNEEEQLIGYDLEVAQANYKGDAMQVIRFTIDKDSVNIANSVRSHYLKHSTVTFNGIIKHTPLTQTKKEEVEFGEAIVKTFTSVKKQYLITGGKAPITTEVAYTGAQIQTLESSYAQYLSSVEADAKERATSGEITTTPQPAKKSDINSLI